MAEILVNFTVRDAADGLTMRADERLTASDARNGRRQRVPHRSVSASVWRVSSARVFVAGREHLLLVAINETTAEVKYFLSNAVTTPVPQLLEVAFRSWTVEHSFRLRKQANGLMDFEGREYIGLVRHLTLTLVVLGFITLHMERLRKKKREVTTEQVCRMLNHRCAVLFRRRRGITELRHTSEIICYHQRRNAAATKTHKKRRNRCRL